MKKASFCERFMFATILCASSLLSFGQTPTDILPGDPAGLYVYTTQDLSFGAFARGNNGGTVEISSTGSRVVTGDLIALNLGFLYNNAIFEVESPPGNQISILNGPAITLNGSNGGSITMTIGGSDPNSPFINNASPPYRTQVNIGGTLTVGNYASSPPGSYSGVFYVTFNQE